MPCPSAQNNFVLDKSKFVLDKIIFVQNKIFCPKLKSHVRFFCKTKEFFSHLKSPFLLKKSHFKELFRNKNGLFSHWQSILSWSKKIVQDNLGFVLDKNNFVCAEGRGIRITLFKNMWLCQTISVFSDKKIQNTPMCSIVLHLSIDVQKSGHTQIYVPISALKKFVHVDLYQVLSKDTLSEVLPWV